MINAVRAASREEVPVLDLAPLTHGQPLEALAAKLDEACRETGFSTLPIMASTRRCLGTSLRQRDGTLHYRKRNAWPISCTRSTGAASCRRGSTSIPVLLPISRKVTRLAWTFPDDPDVMARLPLHAPNQWPEDLPWLRAAVDAYFGQARALGERMLRLIATALRLDEGFFLPYIRKPMVQMRLFHYPPQPAISPDNAFGVAPIPITACSPCWRRTRSGAGTAQARWRMDCGPVCGGYAGCQYR
ncbi:hypothetical protein RAA17_15235 [Komagataeibacter rhaeticus]|nr:hypothetical protein [Komagataeibacter rhaeticus]